MNYDYAKIAKEVIQAVGGAENIKSAAHCATRLRLIVADRSLADDEKVGEIDAVKGTFFTAGQYQIIFGTGNGITTIPGMLLYIYSPSQLIMYVVLALSVFITAFCLCWFFAVPPEVMETDAAAKKDVPKPASAPFPDVLGSAAKGTFVPMEQISDPTFSQGVLGICCGIEPETSKVYSPMDGTISQLADTLHAIGIEAGGVELLIHVGIDTVAMKGDGFQSHVKEGQTVKKGDLLLTMDLEKIKAAGHPATIMVIVTNSDDLSSVEAAASGQLMPGDQLMRLKA